MKTWAIELSFDDSHFSDDEAEAHLRALIEVWQMKHPELVVVYKMSIAALSDQAIQHWISIPDNEDTIEMPEEMPEDSIRLDYPGPEDTQ